MKDVLILCYHAVSDEWPCELAVTPVDLRSQLALLKRRGYAGTTFTKAVSDTPPEKSLAVTFDDGFASVLDLALPIMRELDIPGTIFVPSEFCGGSRDLAWPGIDQWASGPFTHELKALTWRELGSLADAGWEIGSHTRTHPRLTTLEGPALAEELEGSRHACERNLGRPCTSIAYPYGDVDDRVAQFTAAAGYSAAAALPQRLHANEPLEWPRIGVYRGDGAMRFRLKVSRSVRRLRTAAVVRQLS